MMLFRNLKILFTFHSFSQLIIMKSMHRAIIRSGGGHLVRIPCQNEIFISKYPGSRVIELAKPEIGNPLTLTTITQLSNLLETYKGNVAIGAVFFASKSIDLFSNGFDQSTTTLDSIKAAQSLSNQIKSLDRTTIAVYGGNVRGAEGLSIARFLALSGQTISVDALYAMGLLSHIVEHDPQMSLADALAHTIPAEAETKRVQMTYVDMSAIPDLLDTMHVGSDVDPFSDPIVNQLLLVPPQELDDVKTQYDVCDNVILSNATSIDYCLSGDNVNQCLTRLEKFVESDGSSNWASQTINGIKKIDYKVTDVSIFYF